jgi:hypothetical protein
MARKVLGNITATGIKPEQIQEAPISEGPHVAVHGGRNETENI